MQTSTIVNIAFYQYAKRILDEALNGFRYFDDEYLEAAIDNAIQKFDFDLHEDLKIFN